MPPFRPSRRPPRRSPIRQRLTRWLRGTLAVLLLLAALWYVSGPPAGERLAPAGSGGVRAIDGDSFTMAQPQGRVTIRVEGIDAPEYRQSCARANGTAWPCGAEAAAALATLLAEPDVTCTVSAEDQYDRRIARCRTGRTADLGAAMVARGLAIANGRGAFPPYWQEQERAEDARAGIWQGRFDRPADWRRAHPR